MIPSLPQDEPNGFRGRVLEMLIRTLRLISGNDVISSLSRGLSGTIFGTGTHALRLLPPRVCPSLTLASLKCPLTPSYLFISLMFVLVRDNMFSVCSSLLSYSSSAPWAVLSQPVSPDTSPLTNGGLLLFMALRCALYTGKLGNGGVQGTLGEAKC